MVQAIVRRARQRLVCHRLLAQLALSGALVAGGLLLLLVFGTSILDWRFPVSIGVAGLAFGLWRSSQALPSPYESAVRLDQGAGLQDAISTALHFSGASGGPVRDAQQRQAELLARSVDLGQALPMEWPRALYVMAALFLAASAVFAVRFGISRHLDLRPGLAHIVANSFGAKASGTPVPRSRKPDGVLAAVGIHLPASFDAPAGSKEAAPESLTAKVNASATTPRPPALALDGKDKGNLKEGAGKSGDDSEGGDPNKPGSRPGDSAANSKQGGGKQGQADKPGNPNGDNASLMARMKDAMSSLLSKAKQAASGQQQNAQKAGDKKSTGQPAAPSEKGQQAQGQMAGQESAKGQEAGQPGKPGDPRNGANDGKSSESQQAAQAGSGMGRQDGSKELKAARQMEAMGKLSAIIGKRSQNVTGEMMLDTQSGPQRLSTAYSSNAARHADAGGDMSRDQVPLALQSYVQQYFEEVRKTRAPRTPVSSSK